MIDVMSPHKLMPIITKFKIIIIHIRVIRQSDVLIRGHRKRNPTVRTWKKFTKCN